MVLLEISLKLFIFGPGVMFNKPEKKTEYKLCRGINFIIDAFGCRKQ